MKALLKEFIARSNYLRPLEHLIKDGECKKDLTYIEDGKKKIKSDYSLQIYYNHFINNDFGLEILLPSKSYNRLNDKFKIIDARYIAKKYPKIKNRGESRNKIYRVKEILKSEVIDIDKKRDELFKKLKNILESGEKDNDNNQLKLLNVANDKEIKEKQIKKIKTIAQSMNLKN